MAAWLRSLRDGGPAAPRGGVDGWRRLERYLGLPFGAEANMTARRAAPAPGHAPKGRVPWSARVWLHWETLVESSNAYIAWLAAVWLLLATAVLRFAHSIAFASRGMVSQ